MIGKPAGRKPRKVKDNFSRREREIMNALYQLGKGTAAQIQAEIADPPGYTALRTHLSILEKKGHARHESDGLRYIYEPCVARGDMGRRAIDTVLKTFFDNSVERAVAAMLSQRDAEVSLAELERLALLITKARKEGR